MNQSFLFMVLRLEVEITIASMFLICSSSIEFTVRTVGTWKMTLLEEIFLVLRRKFCSGFGACRRWMEDMLLKVQLIKAVVRIQLILVRILSVAASKNKQTCINNYRLDHFYPEVALGSLC